jgi:hypothetical protein
VLDYVPLPEKTQVSDSFVGFSAIATGTPEPSDGCGITSYIIYIRVERSRNGARLLPETVAVRLCGAAVGRAVLVGTLYLESEGPGIEPTSHDVDEVFGTGGPGSKLVRSRLTA